MTTLALPGRVLPTGLELPEGLGFEEWQAIFERLKAVARGTSWWIGDCLRYGERRYGEMYSQALDATDCSYQALRDAKWVAEKFELSRRRDNLSWGHHREVAALPPDQQDELLDLASRDSLSVHELRRAVRRSRLLRTTAAEPPPGKFRVFYVDPPWRYNDKLVDGYGAAEHHYKTLSVEDLCAWPVRDKVEDNAVLFLWVTSPLLDEAFAVIEAWGFKYKSSFVWDKVKHNMGHYNSVRHEFLLVCTRGSCTPEVSTLIDSVVQVERSKHSEKPERFREIIDTLYPSGARCEIFARKTVPPWVPWGDQVAA